LQKYKPNLSSYAFLNFKHFIMKTKQILQYFLLLGLFMTSCTSIERYESPVTTLSTKSSFDNIFALSEKEVVLRASHFFEELAKSGKENVETRSISSMNLNMKTPVVKTIIRTIRYSEDDIELVPVYVINYTDSRSKVAGGFIVMIGDKRLNTVLAYSDSGSWGDEDAIMQNFANLFWINVDELIKNELAGKSLYLKTKSGDPCEYNIEQAFYDNAKRLVQPAIWSQLDPYNWKLGLRSSSCPPHQQVSSYWAVGCWATAMGQIMAYHKKPTSGSYTNYLGQTINATYTWNTMLTSQYISSLSSQGKEMVQNLLAQIGHQMVLNTYGYYVPLMSYGCAGSNSDMPKARAGFAAMGYTTAPTGFDYSYNAVSSEIYANRPVAARDEYSGTVHPFTDHAWVMDGVNHQMVVETTVKYCPNQSPTVVGTNVYYIDYVYCNLGAEIPSNWNGYYLSNIFPPNRVAILTNIQ